MSGRPVRRFVDGLLRNQRTEPARPDDVEWHGQRSRLSGASNQSLQP